MKVLVADDEVFARMLLTASVTELGHDCLVAEDGEQAWQLYGEHLPDVLVTDWMMPGLDGGELCRRIRSDATSHYTYIILVTTLGARDELLAGVEAGADDYLVKPLDPLDLKTRLIAAKRVTTLHRALAASSAELERVNTELARTARTDALTGVGNRRRFDEDLARLDARARRRGQVYGIALCDIDNFKGYNDHYGHPAGDEALRSVAGVMAQTCREGDEVYRYGGEELVVVFPDEELAGALIAGERIRRAIEDLALPYEGRGLGGVITASLGIASLDQGRHGEAGDVVKEADVALYAAKEAGRNRAHPALAAPDRPPGFTGATLGGGRGPR